MDSGRACEEIQLSGAGGYYGPVNRLAPTGSASAAHGLRIECYVTKVPESTRVNAAILQQYAAVRDSAQVTRTHYFEGRYENIYVPEESLPALAPVLAAALQSAGNILGREHRQLEVGFWLNEMGPGHRTLPHSHDEDDELVSGVYYVCVPAGSGELILTHGPTITRLAPKEGMLVLFPPAVVHEVSENCSNRTRLSIGMNFGVRGQANSSQ
jgi:uncharacterized cupin superfamily protein